MDTKTASTELHDLTVAVNDARLEIHALNKDALLRKLAVKAENAGEYALSGALWRLAHDETTTADQARIALRTHGARLAAKLTA